MNWMRILIYSHVSPLINRLSGSCHLVRDRKSVSKPCTNVLERLHRALINSVCDQVSLKKILLCLAIAASMLSFGSKAYGLCSISCFNAPVSPPKIQELNSTVTPDPKFILPQYGVVQPKPEKKFSEPQVQNFVEKKPEVKEKKNTDNTFKFLDDLLNSKPVEKKVKHSDPKPKLNYIFLNDTRIY